MRLRGNEISGLVRHRKDMREIVEIASDVGGESAEYKRE